MKRCFQVHPADNVATLLDDVEAGPLIIQGGVDGDVVHARQPIALGHKICLQRVPVGRPILKYGVPIGVATADILPGEWVHLHNCRSRVDERSTHLDVSTGVPKDTVYE